MTSGRPGCPAPSAPRGEPAVLRRRGYVLECVVEHVKTTGSTGHEQNMGAPNIMPADADVEVLWAEAGRLQDLHLGNCDILAVARAAAQRFAGIGPEIANSHIVEIMHPAHPLIDLALDHLELCHRIEPGRGKREARHERILGVGRCHAAEARVVKSHAGIQRHGAEDVRTARAVKHQRTARFPQLQPSLVDYDRTICVGSGRAGGFAIVCPRRRRR